MNAALSIETTGAGPPIVLLHGWALGRRFGSKGAHGWGEV